MSASGAVCLRPTRRTATRTLANAWSDEQTRAGAPDPYQVRADPGSFGSMGWSGPRVGFVKTANALRTVVLTALVLSGCSGSDTTTAGGDDEATSSGVDRQAEYEQVLAAQDAQHTCMAELGYTVTEEGGEVGIAPMPGDEGDQQFFADLEACGEQNPLPPIAPRSRDELVRLYEAKLDQARCIEDQGHETVPPPSLETYLAEMQRPPESVVTPPWDPLSHTLVGGAVIELQELCPRPSIYTITD